MRNRDAHVVVDVFQRGTVGSNDAVLARIESKLDQVLSLLESVHEQGEHEMADLSALQVEVEENGDVINSAITLMNGLSQQIRDLADDPAAVLALADTLDANTQALANSVAANTTPTP
jgi:uncharacterized protein YqgV (UPF0045/DUF77 family)